MAAGVAGIGVALARVPELSLALTQGGAAFLGWYGVEALRRAASPGAMLADRAAGPSSLRATLGRAAGFTLLNPRVYLDTVLLVGAVGAAQAPDARPWFLVGACLASGAWFASIGYGARSLGPLFARPASWRVLDGLVGATMLVLAAALAGRAIGAITAAPAVAAALR